MLCNNLSAHCNNSSTLCNNLSAHCKNPSVLCNNRSVHCKNPSTLCNNRSAHDPEPIDALHVRCPILHKPLPGHQKIPNRFLHITKIVISLVDVNIFIHRIECRPRKTQHPMNHRLIDYYNSSGSYFFPAIPCLKPKIPYDSRTNQSY